MEKEYGEQVELAYGFGISVGKRESGLVDFACGSLGCWMPCVTDKASAKKLAEAILRQCR